MQMEQILLCSDASHARNEGILLKLAQRAHAVPHAKEEQELKKVILKGKSMFEPKGWRLKLVR